MVYFWAWSKTTISGHKKVSAIWMLVPDAQGSIALDDDQEKTVGIFYGRTTEEKKIREVVCDFVELVLKRKEPGPEIPLRNAVMRRPEDIDRIFGKVRPDLKALR